MEFTLYPLTTTQKANTMIRRSPLRPKYKPCKECNQDSLIWSKGRCIKCATKHSKKRIERTPITKTFTGSGELPLFKEIWMIRKRVSFVSGIPIKEFHPIHFAHVVPKSTYPALRLTPNNIVLLTEEEHRLYDQGTQRQRQQYAKEHPNADWQKLYDLRDSLKSRG